MSNIPARILVLQPIGDVIAITWVIWPAAGQEARLSLCSYAEPTGSAESAVTAVPRFFQLGLHVNKHG